jgi:hypothetical protein
VAAPRVAPDGDDSVTENVSFGSTVVSPATVTATSCVFTLGPKVSVPDAATKSDPEVADPDAVAYCTVTVDVEGADNVTGNQTVRVPELPSSTEAGTDADDRQRRLHRGRTDQRGRADRRGDS